MKKVSISLALIFTSCIYAQSQIIDNKNYYNFQKNDGSFNWLRARDAVPTIIDELLKKGVEYHTIDVGDLLKINDSTRLVVTVSFYKGEKQYGFVYETTHSIPVAPSDRDFLRDKSKASYVQFEKDDKGGIKFMGIDPLPANIMLLKETCYWFQFNAKETKNIVSKDVAETILRQDVDEYLAKL